MPTCQINGISLNYEESGHGPAVMLVHGFPLDGRIWDAQRAALSGHYRVICPDLRGFGQSRSSDAFSIESLADDLNALAAKLNICPYVMGGLSMGGYVALRYVRKYATDLNGLALIDTRAEGDTSEGKQNRNRMIESARASGSSAIAYQMAPKMMAQDTATHRPELVQRLRRIMESCPAVTCANALAAMRDRDDETANLASISVPTLICVGQSDAITPPDVAARMQSQIPRARLVTIKGAGHMTPMEQPEQVNRALRALLDDVYR
jgi:pimeloyl-ACP methyl ester carboxylesterase